jgi:hypothetical protein
MANLAEGVELLRHVEVVEDLSSEEILSDNLRRLSEYCLVD